MSVAAQEDYAFTNKLIFQVIRNLIAYFGKSFILIFFPFIFPWINCQALQLSWQYTLQSETFINSCSQFLNMSVFFSLK